MRIASANINYNSPGDREYIKHLRDLVGCGVLCLQESQRGIRGTRVMGVRKRVRRRTWRILGHVGAHRGVAVGVVLIGGRKVRVLSVHGLHVKTVGADAQSRFYAKLERWCARMTKRGQLWILAGDFNRRYASIARQVSGEGVGFGVDGIIVSPGLLVSLVAIDTTGKRRGWTDHSALIAEVTNA